ncbi:MAG TPA: hypothetical protein VIS06_19415 [Mycobacteriales bacterium]
MGGSGELVLDAMVVFSVAVALVLVRPGVPVPAPTGVGHRGGRLDGRVARLGAAPGFWLTVTAGVIYLNQVLFTIHVRRVHHGDPSFVARYLPDGWFALAGRNAVLDALARHWPAPELLAPSVLRVQAFCELPFVIFAYLTVCRWLGPHVYRRVTAPWMLWLGCASYTVTFGLVEWSLRNPYILDDLALRAAAAVVVPVWVSWTCRNGDDRATADSPGTSGAMGLFAFVLSAAALGYLVLAVYDTALLYNLGHLASQLPGIAEAFGLLAAARLVNRIVARRRAGRPAVAGSNLGLDTLVWSLRWFLVLSFVPALAIRYGLAFGTAPVAAGAGGLLALAALAYGGWETYRRAPPSTRGRRAVLVWATQVVAALVTGAAGAPVALLVPARYVETVLLHAAVLSVIGATGTCALLGLALGHQSAPAEPSI